METAKASMETPTASRRISQIVILAHQEQISEIQDLQQDQHHAFQPVDAVAHAGPGEEDQAQRAHEHGGVVDEADVVHVQRMDDRRTAQDQQDIEGIGTQHVAQRQPAFALRSGNAAGGQFRQRGAGGQDGDGDELVAQAGHLGVQKILLSA